MCTECLWWIFKRPLSIRVVTPNPDVYCNRFVKFKAFSEYVRKKFDVDTIATGHYARILHAHESRSTPANAYNPILMRAVDHTKDQTYFLSLTESKDLRHVIFPVGELTKKRVKEIAAAEFKGNRIETGVVLLINYLLGG
jgi:tRNA-specific 2-thiouridylase